MIGNNSVLSLNSKYAGSEITSRVHFHFRARHGMDLAIAVHANLQVLFGLEESKFHDAGLRAGVDRRLDSTLSAIADGSAGRIIGIHRTVVVVAGAAIETDVGPPDDQVAPAEAICSLIGCCGGRHYDLVEVRIPAAVLDLSPALLPVVVILG